MTWDDRGENIATQTKQDTLKNIYHDAMTGSGALKGWLKTLIIENRDQYLVIRNGDGRIMIKVSLFDGLLLVALSLLIIRLRWMPLLVLVLSLVRLQMTIETDNQAAARTVKV